MCIRDRRIRGCVVAIQVEIFRVALVGLHEELLAVLAETEEGSLQLFAGRQVFQAAVRGYHVQVVEFVAALVTGDQHAVVMREIGDGVMVVASGPGDRRPFTTLGGKGVRIPYAGLVLSLIHI